MIEKISLFLKWINIYKKIQFVLPENNKLHGIRFGKKPYGYKMNPDEIFNRMLQDDRTLSCQQHFRMSNSFNCSQLFQ